MFDIGSSEIIVVLLVSLILVEPSKISGVISNIGVYYRRFLSFKQKVMGYVVDLEPDEEVKVRYIKGEDGLMYKAYVVDEDDDQLYKSIDFVDNQKKEKETNDSKDINS